MYSGTDSAELRAAAGEALAGARGSKREGNMLEGIEYIAIVGEDGVGKSTLAKALGAELSWKVGETSDVVGDYASRLLQYLSAFEDFKTREAVLEEMNAWKEEFRNFKRELGDILCRDAKQPGFMVEACLNIGARIIVGIRREEEFRALLDATVGKKLLLIVVGKAMQAGSPHHNAGSPHHNAGSPHHNAGSPHHNDEEIARYQLNVDCEVLAKVRGKAFKLVVNFGLPGELEGDAKGLADLIKGVVLS